MMNRGEIDRLIGDLKDEGSIDSTDGVFTLNFAAAREKLAEFSLQDSKLFILKLVQAANLEATGLSLRHEKDCFLAVLSSWNDEHTVQEITQKFAGESLSIDDSALGYLTLSLITLTTTLPIGVSVTQKVKGETTSISCSFDTTLEPVTKHHKVAHKESTLEIRWPDDRELSIKVLQPVLVERCAFSAIPIEIENKPLQAPFPDTDGENLHPDFLENQVVVWQHFFDDVPTPNLIDDGLTPTKGSGAKRDRLSSFRLTVDLAPRTTVYFLKAGVLIQQNSFDFKTPGVVGVVAVDDLKTDVSGMQVIKDERYEELTEWLDGQCEQLFVSAKEHPYELKPSVKVKKKEAQLGTLVLWFVMPLCAYLGAGLASIVLLPIENESTVAFIKLLATLFSAYLGFRWSLKWIKKNENMWAQRLAVAFLEELQVVKETLELGEKAEAREI